MDSDKANGALSVPWSSGEISDKAGLEALAKKLNPVVGYWGEPLSLSFFFFGREWTLRRGGWAATLQRGWAAPRLVRKAARNEGEAAAAGWEQARGGNS